MNHPTPQGGWNYSQPAAPEPKRAPWRSPTVWIAALVVVILALVVFLVVVLGQKGDNESSTSTGRPSDVVTFTVDPTMFPGVSQPQFEAAVTQTCQSFRARVGEGTSSAYAFATFIRVSSREVLVRNGWIAHTSNTANDQAMIKNQEVTLEAAAFQGPNGPCSGYEDSFNQVANDLNQMP